MTEFLVEYTDPNLGILRVTYYVTKKGDARLWTICSAQIGGGSHYLRYLRGVYHLSANSPEQYLPLEAAANSKQARNAVRANLEDWQQRFTRAKEGLV